MPDKLTPQQRHKCMSHIRAKNTKPEVIVRKRLWKAGFRYRLYAKDLPGTPDIVMRKYKIAIFVNGCFWHGHHAFHLLEGGEATDLSAWPLENSECCKIPKSNSEFWRKKITRNIERDVANFHWLKAKGWTVLVVWECQLRGKERQEQTLRALIHKLDSLILEHYKSKHGAEERTDLPRPYDFGEEDSVVRIVADDNFMKIVLAFDSFKGSLTADEAVEAAREGVLSVYPDAEVVSLPLADGGEGTTAALCRFWDAEWITCEVHDPLFRTFEAKYAVCDLDLGAGIAAKQKTAIMEMASAAGLTLLKNDERNPKLTTTFGVGEMMLDAIRRGCNHILIGIGGSATSDCGIGMLAALGVHFFDENDDELQPIGGNLSKIVKVDWGGLKNLSDVMIDVVCDVQNPLFGENGSAHVYAPQKGASLEDVEDLDNGLRHFAKLCELISGKSNDSTKLENFPGSGAAGGLGFALLLLGANLRRGIEVILDAANLDQHLKNADLVITGEGKIDRQTLNGKLPFGVLQHAKSQNSSQRNKPHGIPVIAFAGIVENKTELLESGFYSVNSINPQDISKEDAMNTENAKKNLTTAVSSLLRSDLLKIPQ